MPNGTAGDKTFARIKIADEAQRLTGERLIPGGRVRRTGSHARLERAEPVFMHPQSTRTRATRKDKNNNAIYWCLLSDKCPKRMPR